MADSKKDKSTQLGLATPADDPSSVPYGLAPRLPISFNKRDGVANIKSYKELATQNLKMLLLTVPGERIMDPNFGVGLSTYLFEQNHPSTHATITSKIYEQVGRYLPFLEIQNVIYRGNGPEHDVFDGNLLNVEIQFLIIPLQLSTVLELSLESN